MIRDFLTEDMIKTEVSVSSWREAVYVVGNLLKRKGLVQDSFIKSMILTIEDLGPYVILLPGIAFFHGSPQSGVHQVGLSFATFKEDVVFTDFEQQHIQCAFGFGAVDANSHMQILMQITKLLQDDEFIDLARNHGSKAKILEKIQSY